MWVSYRPAGELVAVVLELGRQNSALLALELAPPVDPRHLGVELVHRLHGGCAG